MTVTLYIEGGGEGKTLGARFRKGWRRFLDAAAVSRRVRIVRGGSRQKTFKSFDEAVSDPRADAIAILLVDSEGAVATGHSAWRHLQAKDGWKKPENANEDQAFLMVQIMETWLLADRKALRRYFGKGFRDGAIESWPALEGVPKSRVLDALKNATAECSKSYAKGRTSFELLGEVDPVRVSAACPHANALLQRLNTLSAQVSLP